MNTRTPKTYTLAVTKTIVVGIPSTSFEEAQAQAQADLVSGLYQEQWAKARARIDLIEIGADHG